MQEKNKKFNNLDTYSTAGLRPATPHRRGCRLETSLQNKNRTLRCGPYLSYHKTRIVRFVLSPLTTVSRAIKKLPESSNNSVLLYFNKKTRTLVVCGFFVYRKHDMGQ